MRILAGILMATALAGGCVTDIGDDEAGGGGGKADGYGTCDLPQYGDGTCHIDLACEVPDIDCYVTFDTDAAAATWLNSESLGRGAALAETDPRFMKGRTLLDTAWDLYKTQVPVGKLGEKRIGLVVVDNPASNAFVTPDPDGLRGGHMITIHSKALDGTESDLELTAVLFHELKHLSGMHWLPDIEERLNKYYIAPEGSEPIGARQAENARAKALLAPFRKVELLIGPYIDERFGGLPVGGDIALLYSDALAQNQQNVCDHQVSVIADFYKTLDGKLSAVDDSLPVDATMAATVTDSTYRLGQCMQVFSVTLDQVIDAWGWRDLLKTEVPAEDLAKFGPMRVMDGLFGVVAKLRANQRAAQATIEQELGRPLSAMRYFSYEEQADDTSVAMLKRAHLDAASAASSWLGYLGDKKEQCVAAHTAGPVPYGVALSDPHHGTCWRYAHHLQLAELPETMARETSPFVEARTPRVPRPAPVRRPIE